jgi:hypothetical protein
MDILLLVLYVNAKFEHSLKVTVTILEHGDLLSGDYLGKGRHIPSLSDILGLRG